MSFMDRIAECNRHTPSRYVPLLVDGRRRGSVAQGFAAALADERGPFLRAADGTIALDPALDDFESRTAAVAARLEVLRNDGLIPAWRDEAYPVIERWGEPPLFLVERAAVPLLGLRAFGVHMNGYVRRGDGLHMWIGHRSKTKPTFPGKLDNLVAGGQPAGLSLFENLVKESGEEANVPPALAARAVPVSVVTYTAEIDGGLKPDVMYCFDLELPEDFTPRNMDGEIESFELWPMDRVAEVVRETQSFKFNCNLVIIDFLVRHGVIPPEHPDYVDIVRGLRQ